MSETLMTMGAAPARRLFSLASVGLLGAILIYIALAHPPASLAWQAFLLVLGALALVLANRMWWATASVIELREEGLFDSDGTRICAMENIASVDRGMFAFKPSNGFLVRLKSPAPRAWAPGMWWRIGRRVGIGGATPRAEGKIMADLLTARLQMERSHAPED